MAGSTQYNVTLKNSYEDNDDVNDFFMPEKETCTKNERKKSLENPGG